MMKKIINSILICTMLIILGGCSVKDNGKDIGATAPTIIINDNKYTAPDMPVENLPEDYRYLRELTKSEANGTGYEGSNIYVNPKDAEMNTIYLYQECGTPINNNTVDKTQLQWAYVQYIKNNTQD